MKKTEKVIITVARLAESCQKYDQRPPQPLEEIAKDLQSVVTLYNKVLDREWRAYPNDYKLSLLMVAACADRHTAFGSATTKAIAVMVISSLTERGRRVPTDSKATTTQAALLSVLSAATAKALSSLLTPEGLARLVRAARAAFREAPLPVRESRAMNQISKGFKGDPAKGSILSAILSASVSEPEIIPLLTGITVLAKVPGSMIAVFYDAIIDVVVNTLAMTDQDPIGFSLSSLATEALIGSSVWQDSGGGASLARFLESWSVLLTVRSQRPEKRCLERFDKLSLTQHPDLYAASMYGSTIKQLLARSTSPLYRRVVTLLLGRCIAQRTLSSKPVDDVNRAVSDCGLIVIRVKSSVHQQTVMRTLARVLVGDTFKPLLEDLVGALSLTGDALCDAQQCISTLERLNQC